MEFCWERARQNFSSKYSACINLNMSWTWKALVASHPLTLLTFPVPVHKLTSWLWDRDCTQAVSLHGDHWTCSPRSILKMFVLLATKTSIGCELYAWTFFHFLKKLFLLLDLSLLINFCAASYPCIPCCLLCITHVFFYRPLSPSFLGVVFSSAWKLFHVSDHLHCLLCNFSSLLMVIMRWSAQITNHYFRCGCSIAHKGPLFLFNNP